MESLHICSYSRIYAATVAYVHIYAFSVFFNGFDFLMKHDKNVAAIALNLNLIVFTFEPDTKKKESKLLSI